MTLMLRREVEFVAGHFVAGAENRPSSATKGVRCDEYNDNTPKPSIFTAMPNSSDLKLPAPDTKLEDVIAEKQGFLKSSDSVQKAGDKMRSLGVEDLPVSEGRHLVGVVDQPRPDLSAAGHGHDPNTLTIREAMNREVIYCFEEDDCATALHRMDEHGLKHITVVDQQLRIVGMVRHEDLQAVKGG
jgi:predicted transcriptional regulator